MKTLIALGLAAASVFATAAPTFAHHSFSMFDPSQEVVIQGTVARWAFNSPHTFMIIEDADGTTWAFEGAAPASLIARDPSMTGDTFPVGSQITVIQCPLRDGRPGGAGGIYIGEDGTVYNPSDAGCRANQRIEQWPAWVEAGYMSLVEVNEAGEIADEEMPADVQPR